VKATAPAAETPSTGAPGQPSLEAVGLSVTVGDHLRLLDSVSFHAEGSSLLAILGPSGSGKTTLLNALTGFRPANEGAVYYAGRDLYADYDELRSDIGYVPQQSVLHEELRVGQALGFAARLRFPDDVPRNQREARVREVIQEIELTDRVETRISSLSGGQQKRVNMALELLTKPSLLFLDEPTSGLDPGNEREMMELLRQLASRGRIVIVVTHSAQSLDLCDRVLFLAPGGKLAYIGEPRDALRYFGIPSEAGYAATFSALEEQKDIDWKARFESSPQYAQFVGRTESELAERDVEARQPLPPPPLHSFVRQLAIIVRRQLALTFADRGLLAYLALQAFGLAFLYFVTFSPRSLSTRHGDTATLIVWLLAVGATWLGVSNAIREIVKERPVYRRERSTGLAIAPYVAGKAVFLGALTVLEAFVLVGISLARQHLPASDDQHLVPVLQRLHFVPGDFAHGSVLPWQRLEVALAIALTGVAAVALGLGVSTVVRNSNQALTVLPLLLAIQILLSMPLINSKAVDLAGNLMSAKWGLDASASSISLNVLRAPFDLGAANGKLDVKKFFAEQRPTGLPAPGVKPLTARQRDEALRGKAKWDHRPSVWWRTTLVNAVLGVAFLAFTWANLRRQDLRILPERGRAPAGRGRSAPGTRPAPALEPSEPLFRARHIVLLAIVAVLIAASVAYADSNRNRGRAEPFPDAAEASLLQKLPPDVAATCLRGARAGGASAAAACHDPADAGVAVVYYGFGDRPALARWYGYRVARTHAGRNGGHCNRSQFAGEGVWRRGEGPALGRILCLSTKQPEVDWTVDTDLVGGAATGRNGNAGGLYDSWLRRLT